EITKLKGDQLQEAANQLLKHAAFYSQLADKTAAVDFAVTVVSRLHDRALRQKDAPIIAKEEVQLLAEIALKGTKKALEEIGQVPPELRMEALRATSTVQDAYLKQIAVYNDRLREAAEETKRLAVRMRWSDQTLNEMLSKYKPMLPDQKRMAQYALQ